MHEDDGLRLIARERLSMHAPPLARDALESGILEVEPNIVGWTGSLGTIHGHLVVLWLDPDTCTRVKEAPATGDALVEAVAGAVAHVFGNALAELKILPRTTMTRASTPYRGRL